MPIGYKSPMIGSAKLTPEGGLAILKINKTGGPTIKGYIAEAEGTTDDGIQYAAGGDVDPMGVFYEEGVPDGALTWIVVSGVAEVYYAMAVTRATFSRVSTTLEALPDGQAVNEALPVPPFATDKHFQEIGHPIESRGSAGLARTVLHFN